MKAIIKSLLALAVLAPLPLAPAAAHHSYAMFDMSKTVELKATVTRFKWQNPHAFIEIDVPVKGQTERWAIEMTSRSNRQQSAWRRASRKPGDKIPLYIHPLPNGSKGGSYVGVRLPDGSTLGEVK